MESDFEGEIDQLMRNAQSLLTQRIEKQESLVYILTSDSNFGISLAQQLNHFGYATQIFDDLAKLSKTIAEHRTVAILVDISSLNSQFSSVDLFDQSIDWHKFSSSLIFISDRDDQDLRLKTVRAGGVAFLNKPINMVSLIEKLDELNNKSETAPYRVLVVEDQATVAEYYQMVLKRAQMETDVVTNPQKVLQQIQEFHPDLILMDIYMPGIDGIELAKLIRQIDEYVSTPIIFLSSEENFAKQVEALSLGADDFITKPIKASHLIALVKSRLQRLRVLRSYMVRDSLTGLLNHTSFRGQLMQEVIRAKRQNTKLAFAMLDIDHFKKVNDNHGHLVGDNVLKSLSRLLKQRLRRSDIVGRYGGEEFVAILIDVDAEAAVQIMDEIRGRFSELQHFSPSKGIFTTTISCGISTFPEFNSANALIDAADQALYAAKAAGRNQVLLVGKGNKDG